MKRITIVLIAVIFGLSMFFYFFNSCSRKMVDISDIEQEKIKNNTMSIDQKNDFIEIMDSVATKNCDWSFLPLSEKFKSKYNSKDGIFPNINFYVAICSLTNMDGYYTYTLYSDRNHMVGAAWNAKVKYSINNLKQLDDIEIISIEQFRDNDGNDIITYPNSINNDNIRFLISNPLFYDHNVKWAEHKLDPVDLNNYPCTENYKNKVYNKNSNYNVFTNFFEKDYTDGFLCYPIGKDRNDCINGHEIYAICRLYKEGDEPNYDMPIANYLYKVDYELNDDNKLNDISVAYINEISTEEFNEKYE